MRITWSSFFLYLKRNGRDEWFLPFLYNSQPCESFFRQLRSFTTTYSTVANCSVKEILGRIKKIQLLSDISTNKNFVFPRMKNSIQFPENIVFELPTKEDILAEILKCQDHAAEYARNIGLIERSNSTSSFACGITPIISAKAQSIEIRVSFRLSNLTRFCSEFIKRFAIDDILESLKNIILS